MGTRPRKKPTRRFERWQVLLAAVVAAIASIAVALINLIPGGSTGGGGTGVTSASTSSASTPQVVIAITGLLEEAHPPPPGRQYVWTGTVRGEPSGSSVFVIDKRTGEWLVSPAAVITPGGAWTIKWVISKPPPSARWTAVVYLQAHGACIFPGCPPTPSGSGLSQQPSNIPGVLATTTYQPRVKVAPSPSV
jgi:hypothetical protein